MIERTSGVNWHLTACSTFSSARKSSSILAINKSTFEHLPAADATKSSNACTMGAFCLRQQPMATGIFTKLHKSLGLWFHHGYLKQEPLGALLAIWPVLSLKCQKRDC